METDVATLVRQTYNLLVVDDERTLRFTLKESLSEEGYRVETAADVAEAMSLLEREEFHVALVDQKLPDESGIQLMKRIKAKRPETQVIVMTVVSCQPKDRLVGSLGMVRKATSINSEPPDDSGFIKYHFT